MSAAELSIHLFGASVVALLAAYVYQLFWGAHSSQQQRLGPGSGSLGQRRFRELTLRVDEVPAGTSAAQLESELQSMIAASPDLRGQLDSFVVRSLAPRDYTYVRATLTVGTLLPEDQLLVRLQRASKEFPYRFDYTFHGVLSLCEVASGVNYESTKNIGLTTVSDRALVPLRANNSRTASSAADSRLDPSINQGGSSYNGNATVHGGSYHQGNIINIQKTADRCRADLRVTDPRDDKKRIQDTKGGLLKDSYVWVLENPEFREWRDNEDQQLLWVKGDPGKGKTMLLCGIIDELEKPPAERRHPSYFFCQATDGRLNTATAVLRGLIFMLLDQDASLVSHMKKKYDTAGKALFEDTNAWQALSEILTNILRDPKLQGVCLIVDALDECVGGLPKLLELIVTTSHLNRAKWLVSSRNRPEIEEQLQNVAYRLSLEVNAKSVTTAIDSYITHKVSVLTQRKGYRDSTANEVRGYLSTSADGTFLWVALVCEELSKAFEWEAVQIAKSFPPGLGPLYQRMINQISESRYAALCYRILTLVVTAYRPLSFAESTVFIEEWQGMLGNIQPLHDMVCLCGSFLTVREEIIYFVHQSAKDFLMKEQSAILFPEQQAALHGRIFSQSIEAISRTLKRDLYGLQDLGFSIEDVLQQRPDPDPLAVTGYSCVYWIDHLIDASKAPGRDDGVQEYEAVDRFLQGKGLYWIESLSLLRSISEGIHALARLIRHLQERPGASNVQALVKDAYRLLQTFWPAIESRPLQAYVAPLVLSPRQSLIRGLFAHEAPRWVECRTGLAEQWSACEAVLSGHTAEIRSAAFSADGRRVVSASEDDTVRLWDAQTGTCDAVLEGHTSSVYSAAFSADGRRVVSASWDDTVRLWDAQTGMCDAVLEGHTSFVSSAAFSADGRRVVSASWDNTVRLWDAQTGTCDAVLKCHTSKVNSAAFSADGRRVVSASDDHTARLWDAQTGTCDAVLEGHTNAVNSAAFSADGRRVVSASRDQTIRLWDAQTGTCDAVLDGHTSSVYSAAFSADGRRVVSASCDQTVRLWDAQTGTCLRTYHVGRTSTIALNATGTRIHTDKGDIAIDEARPVDSDTHRLKPALASAPAPQNDFGLSADGAWIQQQSHPVLWLPPECRPTRSAVFATERGTHLVLGCSSGRVYLFYLLRF